MANILVEWLNKMMTTMKNSNPTDSNKKDSHEQQEKVYGLTLEEWGLRWITVGTLDDLRYHTTHLYNYIGLYRVKLNDEILYIGHSTDYYKGGLRQKLLEYVASEQALYTMSENEQVGALALTFDVLIIGNGPRSVEITKSLEPLMIGKYSPKWN